MEGEQQDVLALNYQSLAAAPWNNADNADICDTEPLGGTAVTAEKRNFVSSNVG